MKNSLIETMLLNEPLMLSQPKLNAILVAMADRANIELEGISTASSMSTPSKIESQTGAIAVIPINGSITHKSIGLNAMSGLTSYQEIESQLDEALNNPSVTEIVLDIDSHGGQVSGAFDLADKIYESRSIKPITAFVNEAAYSAAFLLASSASEIFAPRTAGVGSIGVITAHVDNSVHNEQQGRKVTYIKAGIHKADGNPDEPLSEAAHAHIQERIDSSYSLFVNTVARNRGINVDAVIETQAKTYTAESALSLKLIDHVTSINSALSTVLERNRPSKPTNSRRIARRATAIKLTNQSTSHEVGEQ
jgi:signal peptide peptidase SppA